MSENRERVFWLSFSMFFAAGGLVTYGCGLMFYPVGFVVGAMCLAFLATFYLVNH